jgi:AraC family transcriptional regulator of adaptative response/methylated-DNA-[protein]-cysteine methyltransferase
MPTEHKQSLIDYERIEKALSYIEKNFLAQPSLAEIAESVHLSDYHFDRLFKRWAGTSPQRFLHFLTKEYAKKLLAQSKDVLVVTYAAGLSSPGRLHDLFVTYEAMTPGEVKNNGKGLGITYGFHPSPFGECMIAVTDRGICGLTFCSTSSHAHALNELKSKWREASITEDEDITRIYADEIFDPPQDGKKTPLHLILRGTNFQIKVWEALLRIPAGNVVTYHDVARTLGEPGASRAVGTAIANNSIGYLIPCHRVIQKIGAFGEYRWGAQRKKAILGWEAAHIPVSNEHKEQIAVAG